MMEYRGYMGRVDFDDTAKIFHGQVVDTRDLITFQGKSAEELIEAFHDSVDDYLEFCAERGESPEKPFSGKFVTRVDSTLHRKVHRAALTAGKSLNAWVVDALQAAVGQCATKPPAARKLARKT